MPQLSPEEIAALRVSTADSARAFAEDIDYFGSIVDRLETSRGELRRVSAVLRRLLVEKDILAIASPRIGKMRFTAPDNSAFYKLEKRAKILFYSSAGAKIFGLDIMAHCLLNAGNIDPLLGPEESLKLLVSHLESARGQTISGLRLDNFLAQRVLCYNGLWATRRDTIKYVAQVASGVHSGVALTPEDQIVERARRGAYYEVKDGNTHIHMMPELGQYGPNVKYGGVALSFSPDRLDPTLVEMLATVSWLLKSPDVMHLRDVIRAERRS